MITFVATTIYCVLGYDFSLPNIKRNLNYGRQPRIDVVGTGHNVETGGWKAMYPSRVPEVSNEDKEIIKTKELEGENITPTLNYPSTEGSIYHSSVYNNHNTETLDRRHFASDNKYSENRNNPANNNKSNDGGSDIFNGGYKPSNPDVVVVTPLSSQFKTKVPSNNHHHDFDNHDDTSDNIKINLQDIEKSNSYGDKIHADSFRVPRRIHPYSHSATSMYLAQENILESLVVAPRAFQVDQLPSTPQLNAIMNRAMSKVKDLLHELEDDKGKKI